MPSKTGTIDPNGLVTIVVDGPDIGTRRCNWLGIKNTKGIATTLKIYAREQPPHFQIQQAVDRQLFEVALASNDTWQFPTTDHVGEFVLDDPGLSIGAAITSGGGAVFFASVLDG